AAEVARREAGLLDLRPHRAVEHDGALGEGLHVVVGAAHRVSRTIGRTIASLSERTATRLFSVVLRARKRPEQIAARIYSVHPGGPVPRRARARGRRSAPAGTRETRDVARCFFDV